MNSKLDAKQKIVIGGMLSTLGAIGIFFYILFGAPLSGHPIWVVSIFLIGVTAGLGMALAMFGLYESRHLA